MDPKNVAAVVLDFDGTSADYAGVIGIHENVVNALAKMQDIGILWMLASDRSFADLDEVTFRLGHQLKPVALLAQQKYIYLRTHEGRYQEHSSWNRSALQLHRALWKELSPYFKQWQETIARQIHPLKLIRDSESFSIIVSEPDIPLLDTILRDLVRGFQNAQVSGNRNSRNVSHKSFSKAAIVREACRCLGFASKSVFAIGDGKNDLPMLREEVCGGAGCPADASKEVQELVRLRHGIISTLEGPDGTADILSLLRCRILTADRSNP